MTNFKKNALALLLVAAVAAQQAAAYDFECSKVWTGPSNNNSISDCVQDYMNDNVLIFSPALYPLIVVFFIALCYPITSIGRFCGLCGSCKQRPGASCCCGGSEWDDVDADIRSSVYPAFNSKCVRICTLVLLCMSSITLILMYVGGAIVVQSWNDVVKSVDDDIITWLRERKAELVTDLQNPDGTYPPPLQSSTFQPIDDMVNQVQTTMDSSDASMQAFLPIFANVIYAIALLPSILLAFPFLFCCCNCRKCFPCCFTGIFYPVALVYGMIGFLSLGLGVICAFSSGEVQLQADAKPGILGWYTVPVCESVADFQTMKDTITTSINKASVLACNGMLDICDDGLDAPAVETSREGTKISIVFEPHQFSCPMIFGKDLTTVCSTPKKVIHILNNTFAKKDSLACKNVTSGKLLNCSITECATECFAKQMRDLSRTGNEQLAIAQRVVTGISKLFLYADCDVIITRVTMPLSKLKTLSNAFFLVGVGMSWGTLMLGLGILELYKGQKLFFGVVDVSEKLKSIDENAQNSGEPGNGTEKNAAPY